MNETSKNCQLVPSRWYVFPLLLALLIGAGCSDSVDPPTARLVFPPPVSHFAGAELTLRGEVNRGRNNVVGIKLIGDGVSRDAVFDATGSQWVFPDIELTPAALAAFRVDVSSNRRTRISLPVSIDTNAFVARMTDIVSHENGLYAIDARLDSVVSIDVVSGARKIVSSVDVGTGIAFEAPRSIASGADGLYVVDSGLGLLARVDPVTGQRVVVSGVDRGAGPPFVSPRLLIMQPGKALVADVGLDGLVEIDLASGDRTLIYDQFVPDGPVILSPQGMVAQADGTLLVIDDQYQTLLEVNPATNSFTIVSNFETGEGVNFGSPRAMILDANGAIIILDDDNLIEVDAASGDRTVRSGQPTDPDGSLGIAVALTLHDGDFFVADNRFGAVYQVDAVSGAGAVVTSLEVGDGVRFGSPFDVVLVGEDYVITDQSNHRLVRVNGATGRRSIELDASTEVPLVSPNYMTTDTAGGVIYLSYSQFDSSGIVSFDPSTGTASIIAGPVDDLGPPLIVPTDLAYVAATHELLIVDSFRQRLVRLDIATGQRTILSEDDDGNGVPFGFVTAMVFNESTDTAYLLDAGSERIFEVDRLTGRRSEFLPRQSDRHLADVVIDSESQRLLILDSLTGALLALPFTGGAMQTLTGPTTGSGLAFDRPTQMALLAQDNVAVVIDAGLDAVVLVDLTTGVRVVQSY